MKSFGKFKIIVGTLLVLSLMVGLFSATVMAQDDSKFYGLSTKIVHNVWEGLSAEAFRWYCEDNGWKYNVLQARANATLQNTHIRRLVDMGADGIVVGAADADIVAAGVKYAKEHDVPVISMNADVNSEDLLMFVGYSGVRASRILGEKIVEHLKNEVEPIGEVKGKVLEIRGPMGGASAKDRHQGFIEVMNKYDGVKVETVVGEYQRGPAKTAALPKVRARDFDALYAGNGPMVMGGISAMENVGKNVEEKMVATIDAIPSVIDAIKEGKVDYAFDQPCPFYNPIALYYLNKYIEEGEDALPEPGQTITTDDLNIEQAEHAGITWWKTPMWAPAQIKTKSGHLWFQTNGLLVDESNCDLQSLWANAELPGW